MNFGWGFWLSSVLATVLGMVIEGVFGIARKTSMRLVRRFAANRHLVRAGNESDLIRRGAEELLVIQSVHGGWDPERVEFIEQKSPAPLEELFEGVDARAMPGAEGDLISAIEAERLRLESSQTGEWNGRSLAVVHCSTRSRSRKKEAPLLEITVRPSDHATHTVISDAWLKKFDHSPRGEDRDLDNGSELVGGMVHSIGLNATLVTADNKVIITRRSVNASSQRNGRHISVNEGMQWTDRRRDRLDPYVGLVRGVKEELGIEISTSHVSIHTVMLDLRRYQFGLLGHIDLRNSDISAADILEKRKLGAAVDKFENRLLETIPWTKRAVESVLMEEDWIAHGWLNLFISASQQLGLDSRKVMEDARRRTLEWVAALS